MSATRVSPHINAPCPRVYAAHVAAG